MAQYKMHTAVKRENASRYDVVCIFLGPESDRVVAADSVKSSVQWKRIGEIFAPVVAINFKVENVFKYCLVRQCVTLLTWSIFSTVNQRRSSEHNSGGPHGESWRPRCSKRRVQRGRIRCNTHAWGGVWEAHSVHRARRALWAGHA